MKAKIAVLLLAFATLFVGGTIAPAAANAAPAQEQSVSARAYYGCFTAYEWRTFDLGWSRRAIENWAYVSPWSARYYDNDYTLIAKYNHCGYYYDTVRIRYQWNGYRYVAKAATRY